MTGLYFGCRRAPGCEGSRRIRSPEVIHPVAFDAGNQAIFDWETSREPRSAAYRRGALSAPAPTAGIRGLVGRVLGRPAETDLVQAELDQADAYASGGHFDSLVEHGFVILEHRSLPAARVHIDTVVVGPTGIFVIETKSWTGQVQATGDAIFVDGRERLEATEHVLRAASAFEQIMGHELKPAGATVHPALLIERATNRSFEATVNKVLIGGSRGLPKAIRASGEPALGPETIVRLAVATDRLLE